MLPQSTEKYTIKKGYFRKFVTMYPSSPMKKILLLLILLFVGFAVSGQTNQRDEQGRRQGPWQGLYPNGVMRYQGQFVDDMPTGTFRYYYTDGALRAELHHQPGKETVAAIYFHRNRQRMAVGQFSNNQRVGLWRFFSDMGVKLAENHYQNGLLQGQAITFFPQGTIAETVEYRSGQKHGDWVQYFEDGSKRLIASYENDQLSGLFQLFYENGKPLLQAFYLENLPHETWKFFTNQGELEKEVTYQRGALINEIIYIEREEEVIIPMQPVDPAEDVFSSPF
jgi:antitoxin component YwqK of YwqJK toxin-antitoxin module